VLKVVAAFLRKNGMFKAISDRIPEMVRDSGLGYINQ